MNDDLPQFDAQNISGGWTELNSAFDIAPLSFSVPVAIQVFNREGPRVLVTGVVTSTEDQFPEGSEDNVKPIRSTVYFQHADLIEIEWAKVSAVLVMVALPTEGLEDE